MIIIKFIKLLGLNDLKCLRNMIADSIKQDSCTSPRGCELNPESWRYGKFASFQHISNWEIRQKFHLPTTNAKDTTEPINEDGAGYLLFQIQDKTSGNCEFWHALEGKCPFGCRMVLFKQHFWLVDSVDQRFFKSHKKVLRIYQEYAFTMAKKSPMFTNLWRQ